MALTRVFLEAAKGDIAKPKATPKPAPSKPTLVEVDIAGKTVEIEVPLSPDSPSFSREIDKRARAIERDLYKKGIIKEMVGAANVRAEQLKEESRALFLKGDTEGASKLMQERAKLLTKGIDTPKGNNPLTAGTVFDPSRKPQQPAKPAKKPTPLQQSEQAARNVIQSKTGKEFVQRSKELGDAQNRAALADVAGVQSRQGDPNLVGDEGLAPKQKTMGVGDPLQRLQRVAGTAIRAAGSAISPAFQFDNAQDKKAVDQALGTAAQVPGSPEEILLNLGLAGLGAAGLKLVQAAFKIRPNGSMRDVAQMIFSQEGRTAMKQVAPDIAKAIDEAPVFARAKFAEIPGVSEEAKTFMPPSRAAREIGGPVTAPEAPKAPTLSESLLAGRNAPKSTPIPGASEDVVGLAKQITKRDPLPGTNPARVFEAGREAVETGRVNPKAVVDRVIQKGSTNLNEEEIGATVYRLRQIRNRQEEIEAAAKTGDPLETVTKNKEWAELDDEAEQILTAGDMIGNQWHRTGMALQVAIKRDMSLGGLLRKARTFADEPLKPGLETQIQEISKKYENAMRELDKAKKQYFDDLLRVPRPEEPPRFMAKSRAQARSTASAYFKNQKLAPTGGVGKNRQRGAVSYTVSDDEMRAKSAVRKLAREIVTDGAQTLDEVLDGIRREIGVDVKDEDLLAFLHEPYSKYRLEADTARIKANQVFRELQRAAAFRSAGKVEKAIKVASEGFNGIGRSLTLGFDFSAPFIQGRKFLYTNPKGWAKAFRPMMEATAQSARGNSDYALNRIAKIESDPFYPRAKSAGLQLTLPNAGFTQQEEIFAGNLRAYLEMVAAKSPRAGFAKRIADVIGASEDGYATFLNEVRWDTFKTLAKVDPQNPEYLKDVAQLLNVISGRGTGQFAQSISNPIFGNLLTAPRYTVSQIQYGIGVPLWKAKTGKGFAQAAKVYGVQAAVVPSLMALAAMHGWKVDWDLRSSNVGKISKDGLTIDLFGKDAQFMRLAIQSARGRFNKKGEFTEPSATGVSENLGRYLTGKVAPFPRVLMTERFGVYDDGKTRPVEGKDRAAYFMPIWVADMFKDAEKFQGDKRKQALATLSNIFGLEMKPEELPETRMPAGFGVIGD